MITWLGFRHVKYGVRPHHIPIMGQVCACVCVHECARARARARVGPPLPPLPLPTPPRSPLSGTPPPPGGSRVCRPFPHRH